MKTRNLIYPAEFRRSTIQIPEGTPPGEILQQLDPLAAAVHELLVSKSRLQEWFDTEERLQGLGVPDEDVESIAPSQIQDDLERLKEVAVFREDTPEDVKRLYFDNEVRNLLGFTACVERRCAILYHQKPKAIVKQGTARVVSPEPVSSDRSVVEFRPVVIDREVGKFIGATIGSTIDTIYRGKPLGNSMEPKAVIEMGVKVGYREFVHPIRADTASAHEQVLLVNASDSEIDFIDDIK